MIYRPSSTARSRTPPQRKRGWLDKLLGRQPKPPPQLQGALVAQGTIQIDPRRVTNDLGAIIEDVRHNGGNLLPAEAAAKDNAAWTSLLNHLDYDLYAKTVRTPLRWRDLFKGTMSGFVRLGNSPDAEHLPLLTGVLYVENTQMMYSDVGAPVGKFSIPFDPEALAGAAGGAGRYV